MKIIEYINRSVIMENNQEMKIAENYFNDLLSNDTNIRLKAAKYFSWLARNEYSIFRKEVFNKTNIYEKLYPLLRDEYPKIVCEIIAALGCGHVRYKKDKRIEKELLNLYNSKNKDILYMAIVWTAHIKDNKKYDFILSLLGKTKSQKMIKELSSHFGEGVEIEINNKAIKIFLERMKTIKNEKTKKVIEGRINMLELNMSALLDTPSRSRWTLASFSLDTCDGEIGH
jgi:hypothetical protein